MRAVLGPGADFDDAALSIGEPLLLGTILDETGSTTAIQVQVLRPRVEQELLAAAFAGDEAAQETAAALYSIQVQRASVRGIEHHLRAELGLALPTPEFEALLAEAEALPEGEPKRARLLELRDPTRNFTAAGDGGLVRKYFEYEPDGAGGYVDLSEPSAPLAAPADFRPEGRSDYDFHLGGVPFFERNFEQVGMADSRYIPLMFLVIALALFAVFRGVAGVALPLLTVFLSIACMLGLGFAKGRPAQQPDDHVAQHAHRGGHRRRDPPAGLLGGAALALRGQARADHRGGAAQRAAGAAHLADDGGGLLLADGQQAGAGDHARLHRRHRRPGGLPAVHDADPRRALAGAPPQGRGAALAAGGGLHPRALPALRDGAAAPPRPDPGRGVGVLAVLSAVGLARVEIDTDFRGMFPDDNPTMSDFHWIETRLGGVGDLELVFGGAPLMDEGELPPALDAGQEARLEELRLRRQGAREHPQDFAALGPEESAELAQLEGLQARHGAARIGVSTDFLASLDAFEARLRSEMAQPGSDLAVVTDLISPLDILRKMHQVQNENAASYYRVPGEADVPAEARRAQLVFDEWLEEWSRTPAQSGATLAAQYYLQYENGARPGENLTTQLSADRTRFRMQGRVVQASSVAHRAAFERIEEIARTEFPELGANLIEPGAGADTGDRSASPGGSPGALASLTISGKTLLFARTSHLFTVGFMQSMAIALVAITLLIGIIFRSARLALVSLVPNVLPIVVPLAAFGLVGVPIHGPAILVSSVALGVCVDDTIHFLTKFSRARGAGQSVEEALSYVLQGVRRRDHDHHPGADDRVRHAAFERLHAQLHDGHPGHADDRPGLGGGPGRHPGRAERLRPRVRPRDRGRAGARARRAGLVTSYPTSP